jgi:hypothetical protein
MCSTREHTMFAPAELLRNWRGQRPSNMADLDSGVKGEVGRVYYTGVDLLLISFVFGCVLNDTPCMIRPVSDQFISTSIIVP